MTVRISGSSLRVPVKKPEPDLPVVVSPDQKLPQWPSEWFEEQRRLRRSRPDDE